MTAADESRVVWRHEAARSEPRAEGLYRCLNCGRDESGCECEGGGSFAATPPAEGLDVSDGEAKASIMRGLDRNDEYLRAAESDYLTAREQKRLACVCGHAFIRHTEYGCIECGTSEATTKQHNFTRTFAALAPERPREGT